MISRIDGIYIPVPGLKQYSRAERLIAWDKKNDYGFFSWDNREILVPNARVETFGNWVRYGTIPGEHLFVLRIYYRKCTKCDEQTSVCLGHFQRCLGTYSSAKQKCAAQIKKDEAIKTITVVLFDFPFSGWKRKQDVVSPLWQTER